MNERPLENASSLSVRMGQLVLLAALFSISQSMTFPIRVRFVHVAGVVAVMNLLGEIDLSLSRRSVLSDEHERTVNEFLIGIAQYPGAWPIKSVIKMAERRSEHARRQRAIVKAKTFLETTVRTIEEEFDRKDWLVEEYDPPIGRRTGRLAVGTHRLIRRKGRDSPKNPRLARG